MAPVLIYVSRSCPYCVRAKQLLIHKHVTFDEVVVDGQPALRAEMEQRSGRRTVPQIWIGDRHVGGCDDLHELEADGELDALLAAVAPGMTQ